MSDDADFDLDAAGLRADGSDVATGVEVLAIKLEAALPAQTVVRRRARRLLSRDKAVEAIEVNLGDWRYALRLAHGRPEASREQAVRGVVIRRQALELGDWVRGLTGELREQATTSAEAREALERLVG
jgi:nitroreductase